MLKIFKKKFEFIAPISGKVLDLTEVPDQIFAQKLAGDGIAIDSTGDVILAPADGTLSLIFKTHHAFGMSLSNGVELLVHIGLDTVELQGLGFERIAIEGQKVKAGDPIIKINREILLSKGVSLITPVIITNMNKVKEIHYNTNNAVQAGKDVILTYMTR